MRSRTFRGTWHGMRSTWPTRVPRRPRCGGCSSNMDGRTGTYTGSSRNYWPPTRTCTYRRPPSRSPPARRRRWWWRCAGCAPSPVTCCSPRIRAKSVFPGARVGFLVADQTVVDADGRRTLLAEELSAVKSMLTVNTSPIAQSVIGGFLVSCGCSLRAANQEKIAFYRRNLRTLLTALDRSFAGIEGVGWNAPDGGFFAVLDTPVIADDA